LFGHEEGHYEKEALQLLFHLVGDDKHRQR
jgi:hypothetical protein